jgi:hypothetical protein
MLYEPIRARTFHLQIPAALVAILGLAMVLPALVRYRRKRRAKHLTGLNACPVCRYDLRGSVDSERCPECGTVIDDATRQRIRAMGQTPSA